MNILYATYLFTSAAVLLVLAVIGWQHRSVSAAREFSLFSASIAFAVGGYALELTQDRFEVLKFIMLRVEWLIDPYVPAFWLLFSLVWCGYGHFVTRSLRAALLVIPTIGVILAQSNDYHHLLYKTLWVEHSGAFHLLRMTDGLWSWVDFVYMDLCVIIATILFVQQYRKAGPLYRRQALIMMVASLIPWSFHIGYVLGVGNGIYITSFGLTITGMMFAWGMFRHRLLDMTPVARYGLVEMMRDPVLVFDEGGRLADYNRAACRLLHTTDTHDTVIARADIADLIPELAEAIDLAEQEGNHTFQHAGQVFSLSLTAMHPTNERTLTLCLLHDITEQSRAEDELRILNSTLEERIEHEVALNRAKDQALSRQTRIAAMGEMVAAIAHQWRQPLAILSIIVQDFHAAARQEGAPSQAEWDEFRGDALEQIRHMSQTIEEFRNFQRPDQKQERFPVVRCLEESLRLSSAQFKEHNIVQELRVSPDVSPYCLGTPSQMTQVLLTLLVNAKEAIEDARTRNSGRPEQGRVTMEIAVTEERLCQVIVSDNGSGIPAEQRDRIFEPYMTTKEEQGGSGLGLYIAKMLVETGFCGRLRYSPLPEGACFIVELPVAAEDVA